MKIKQYRVNEKGLAEIHTFLAENHTLGGDYFSRAMLQAWASEAEFQISECGRALIEIQSRSSISGNAENYVISDDGLDCEEVEVEE